jgi:hypothetical protein
LQSGPANEKSSLRASFVVSGGADVGVAQGLAQQVNSDVTTPAPTLSRKVLAKPPIQGVFSRGHFHDIW